MNPGLSIWVVYDHPRDYPRCYVARRWVDERPTSDVVVEDDIEHLRDRMQEMGLFKLMAHPEDDPIVMETWL